MHKIAQIRLHIIERYYPVAHMQYDLNYMTSFYFSEILKPHLASNILSQLYGMQINIVDEGGCSNISAHEILAFLVQVTSKTDLTC